MKCCALPLFGVECNCKNVAHRGSRVPPHIEELRNRENDEFRASVMERLEELDGVSENFVGMDFAAPDSDVTVKIEVKCECGADAVKAAYHSAWCPKGTK